MINYEFRNWRLIAKCNEAQQFDKNSVPIVINGVPSSGWDAWYLLIDYGDNHNEAEMTQDGNKLTYTFGDNDLPFYGEYEIELLAVDGDKERRTNIVKMNINRSSSGDMVWVELPTAFSQARDESIAAKNDAVVAKVAAEAARDDAINYKELAENAKDEAYQYAQDAQSAAQTAAEDAVEASAEELSEYVTRTETAYQGAVAAKTASESARDESIAAKEDAEDALAGAESAKDSAIAAKEDAESAVVDAETAVSDAEAARDSAVLARTGAQEAMSGAVDAKNEAELYKQGAEDAADDAADMAALAESEKDAAIAAKEEAVGAETNAKQYENAAAGHSSDAASSAAAAAASAAQAAAVVTNHPYIGANGNWYVYSNEIKGYIDTRVHAKGDKGDQGIQGPRGYQGYPGAAGEDGFSPSVSVVAITGGHRVTITDKTGTNVFDVMDGQGGGGTGDHRDLTNRDAANQHPINAITGLEDALDDIPSALSELSDDASHRLVTDAEKSAWSAKQDAPIIKSTLDSILVPNAQYYLGEQSAVNIVLPSGAETGRQISVVWYNGATPATLSITGTVIDVSYTPSANSRSEVNALWDGTYWSVVTNEQAVPAEETV